ncbi:MAG: hypothetical protein HYS78_01105 [Parcubacteria group bacterium]|nr:hypothetical protein [Parcubacteria group bacterium]
MLKEIRNQPDHIRALFMWLSVFIVFSLVVFVWLNSFQQKLAFLLNSEKEEETVKQTSPLAVIERALSDLRATIFDLFGLASGTKNEFEVKDNLEDRFGVKIEPRLLPVSE